MEEEWRMHMDVEDEIESRTKMDEQKKKLQKELGEIEKLSCLSEEFQESLKTEGAEKITKCKAFRRKEEI